MKNLLLTFVFAFCMLISASSQVNPNSTYVNGYYKSNGTYVEGYYRTTPNKTINDNYSTYPNYNPHTGKQGTIAPTYDYIPTYTYPTTPTHYVTPIFYTSPTYNYVPLKF